MLTKDDISQIRDVIKEEITGTEGKIDGVEKRIISVDQGLVAVEKRLSAKIDKVQESVDIVQDVVVKHFGKLEKRVTSLEEELRGPTN